MLVILAAVAVSRQAVLAQAPVANASVSEKTSWMNRLSVGLSRSITRNALLQRLTFDVPPPHTFGDNPGDRACLADAISRRHRFCLPPPRA